MKHYRRMLAGCWSRFCNDCGKSPRGPSQKPRALGFSARRVHTSGSTAERRWEEEFRAVPAPDSAREHLRRLDC